MPLRILLLISLLMSIAPVAEAKVSSVAAGPTPAQQGTRMAPPPPLPLTPGQPKGDSAVLEKVGPGLFRLGEITISKDAGSVSLPAVVNQGKGALEYLLVRKGGKTHESLLRTDVDPAALQVALLLIGLEGTDRPLARQGDPDAPRGNPVEVTLSYQDDPGRGRVHPEQWVTRNPAGAARLKEGDLSWVFTGSVIRNERFLAQVEGSIIALYHDPAAMIDNASPGGESDRVWAVREGALPPVGTPVTVTIQARNP